MLALRWWPETWDLSAVGKQVDVKGMLLLGGAVLFLTMALIEANPFGGDLPLWLSLMQGAILLGVLFFWWERRAPDPMITPGPAGEPAVPQRQHRDAVLRGGRDRLAAAAVARVREPLGLHAARGGARDRSRFRSAAWWRGRSWASAADTRPPGELAKPALIVMAVGMLIGVVPARRPPTTPGPTCASCPACC